MKHLARLLSRLEEENLKEEELLELSNELDHFLQFGQLGENQIVRLVNRMIFLLKEQDDFDLREHLFHNISDGIFLYLLDYSKINFDLLLTLFPTFSKKDLCTVLELFGITGEIPYLRFIDSIKKWQGKDLQNSVESAKELFRKESTSLFEKYNFFDLPSTTINRFSSLGSKLLELFRSGKSIEEIYLTYQKENTNLLSEKGDCDLLGENYFLRRKKKNEFSSFISSYYPLDSKFLEAINGLSLDFLVVNGIQNLVKKQAKLLVKFNGVGLKLKTLRELEPSTIAFLVKWKGYSLSFDQLEKIDEENAKELVKFRGIHFSFPSLNSITPGIGHIFSQWKGKYLDLQGLKELNLDLAKALVLWSGTHLNLSGIQQITPSVAHLLAQWKGEYLFLNGIQALDEKTANALFQWEGKMLFLRGCECLGNREKMVIFKDSKVQGVSLNGLKQIDLEMANNLSQLEDITVLLEGLKEISKDVAKILLSSKANVYFWRGLETLDHKVAKLLLTKRSRLNYRLDLKSLKTLDEQTAKVLSEWNGKCLFLSGIQTLDQKSAYQLANWRGTHLHLEGIQKMEEGVIDSLSHFGGYALHLDGLAELNQNEIGALGCWEGFELYLSGLKSLNDNEIEALLQWNGRDKRLIFPFDLRESLEKHRFSERFLGKVTYLSKVNISC